MITRLAFGVLLILLLASGICFANTNSEEPMEKVSFKVKVIPSKEVSISKDVLQRLNEVTKKLVKTYLSIDYDKSWKIIAETKILRKIKNGYQCESLVTFLYRKTYTAVLIRMQFYYIPEQIENVKIQRNYYPEQQN